MATIILTIPDAQLQRVTNALCSQFNISYIHPHSIDVNGNPVTSGSDAKATLVSLIKQIVLTVETASAQAAIVPPDVS